VTGEAKYQVFVSSTSSDDVTEHPGCHVSSPNTHGNAWIPLTARNLLGNSTQCRTKNLTIHRPPKIRT
jgi:hypothetical protein